MQEFDRIFNRDDVFCPVRVDMLNYCREAGGLATAGCSGNEHESATLLTDLFQHLRQLKFIDGEDVRWNDAQDHSDAAALLEEVTTEPPQTSHPVGHVQFGVLLEFLFLPIGHHAQSNAKRILSRQPFGFD